MINIDNYYMRLILPSIKYKESYKEALEEVKHETQETQLNKPFDGEYFEDFIQRLKDNAKGLKLEKGYVPATMFWLVDSDEFIGRLHIRHELNENLLRYGGHIGFYVRPSKRKMGYGTRMLKLGLKKAKKLGLSKVLITCDDNNIGSRRIIEKNGGILENIEDGNPKKRRYWVPLD